MFPIDIVRVKQKGLLGVMKHSESHGKAPKPVTAQTWKVRPVEYGEPQPSKHDMPLKDYILNIAKDKKGCKLKRSHRLNALTFCAAVCSSGVRGPSSVYGGRKSLPTMCLVMDNRECIALREHRSDAVKLRDWHRSIVDSLVGYDNYVDLQVFDFAWQERILHITPYNVTVTGLVTDVMSHAGRIDIWPTMAVNIAIELDVGKLVLSTGASVMSTKVTFNVVLGAVSSTTVESIKRVLALAKGAASMGCLQSCEGVELSASEKPPGPDTPDLHVTSALGDGASSASDTGASKPIPLKSPLPQQRLKPLPTQQNSPAPPSPLPCPRRAANDLLSPTLLQLPVTPYSCQQQAEECGSSRHSPRPVPRLIPNGSRYLPQDPRSEEQQCTSEIERSKLKANTPHETGPGEGTLTRSPLPAPRRTFPGAPVPNRASTPSSDEADPTLPGNPDRFGLADHLLRTPTAPSDGNSSTSSSSINLREDHESDDFSDDQDGTQCFNSSDSDDNEDIYLTYEKGAGKKLYENSSHANSVYANIFSKSGSLRPQLPLKPLGADGCAVGGGSRDVGMPPPLPLRKGARPTISTTLERIIDRVLPSVSADPFRLKNSVRRDFCWKLYLIGSQTGSWQLLAERALVLSLEEVEMIEKFGLQFRFPPPEIVLHHWQYLHSINCTEMIRRAPTRENLIEILRDLQRDDLVDFLAHS